MKKNHIPFYGIAAGKVPRYFRISIFWNFIKMIIGIFQARKILKKLKPDLLFAKGGYVGFPVIYAAHKLKIPIWYHESDASLGLAGRYAKGVAQKILFTFEESAQRPPGKVVVSGNPIREEIFHGSKERGYEITGFSPSRPVLLIIGGSTGALGLNEFVWDMVLPALLKMCQVVHVTGKGKGKALPSIEGYKQFEYLDEELAHVYGITDAIVSRAGASAVCEIVALKKPNLLIPLGKEASRGDQLENAEIARKHGWSLVLTHKALTPETFLSAVHTLLNEKSKFNFDGSDLFRHSARKIADLISHAAHAR